MFQARVVETTETHIFYGVTLFENRAVYEIMWKNMVEPVRPRMTVRIRISCWVPKATIPYPEYVTFIAFPTQKMDAQTHLNITFIHTLPVFYYLMWV
jgi:hypothetical protein